MSDFQLLRDRLAALPVHHMIDPIVRDVRAGSATVIAASTGSGKSMLLPGALADWSDHQIVVLVPRRFLAIDAALNVAELSGTRIGIEVGYALGQIDGESSQHSPATKLLYCTYGYAISSGLITRAKTIVLDEVHEADELISLARALLYERKKTDTSLRILEMSATVDAHSQARYWQPVAPITVHIIEGTALACDVMHEPVLLADNKGRTAEHIIVDLLTRGRKGIVLFRPGVREVEESTVLLADLLLQQGLSDVEISAIHGGTPADERRVARRAPDTGKRKVIVGTNVIESGVNLRWLDAGVSDGYRKVPYHRDDTGAEALVREDLSQAGLLQQMGRINRDPAATGFDRGLFVLHAKKPFDLRRTQNGPAIQRQLLNGIAFYAAGLGFDPTRLTWDIPANVHSAALPARLEHARQELTRLQLIDDHWNLTKDGLFIKHLPVSPETGAMLAEARRLDEQRMRIAHGVPRVMRDAVVIAALAESHGLRADFRIGHKADQHRTSDRLDAMNAFRLICREAAANDVLAATEDVLAKATPEQLLVMQRARETLKAACATHNVSVNGFIEVARLSQEITHRLTQQDKGIRIDKRSDDDAYDAGRYGELQRCILAAHVNRLFINEQDGLRDLLRDYGKERSVVGQAYRSYEFGRSSIVTPPKPDALVVGALREVQTHTGEQHLPLIVLTDITSVSLDVFLDWAAARDPSLLANGIYNDHILTVTYAGKARLELPIPSSLHRQVMDLVAGITVA